MTGEIVKILYESESPEVEVTEELNESGVSQKKYKIRGTFSTIAERNRNGRVYPRHLWEREVSKYQSHIQSGSINRLCEWEHPARNTVDPMQAVACINKLWIENNKVLGEATILDNEKGNQLKSLIDNGIKISVSSRGTGKVGRDGIVENFNLITYDLVSAPSDANATMNGITESQESYLLTESGELHELTDEQLKKYFKKDVDIAKELKESFEKLTVNEDVKTLNVNFSSSKSIVEKLFKALKEESGLKEFKVKISNLEKQMKSVFDDISALIKEI